MGNVQPPPPSLTPEQRRSVLGLDVSLLRLVRRLQAEPKPESIVLMVGAGLSVSAGIPDFRSPDTGLYANLQKYQLPHPQAIFDIRYFGENPLPFYTLAREMYPGTFHPTLGHFFIRLLQDKGLLRRCYTQNIDTLERQAGVDPELLVEAHGSFGAAHCIHCKKGYTQEWLKEKIFGNHIPVLCPACQLGFVKPDIVFFGESLPERFRELRSRDLDSGTELLLIMGTSLSVQPFAGLADDAHPLTPRLLMNREPVGLRDSGTNGHGLRLDCQDNYRDVALLGDLDEAVVTLCNALGWAGDLKAVVQRHFHDEVADAPNHPLARLEALAPLPPAVLAKAWRRPPVALPPLTAFGAEAPAAPKLRIELVHSGLSEDGSEVRVVVDVAPSMEMKMPLPSPGDAPRSDESPTPDDMSLASEAGAPNDGPAASTASPRHDEIAGTGGMHGLERPRASGTLPAQSENERPNPLREVPIGTPVPALPSQAPSPPRPVTTAPAPTVAPTAAEAEDVPASEADRSEQEAEPLKASGEPRHQGKDISSDGGDADSPRGSDDDDDEDRLWVGLFARRDPLLDGGGEGIEADGEEGEGMGVPDDPRLSAVGTAVLPRRHQLLQHAKAANRNGRMMVRVRLTDDRRRWADPPSGPHEVWYLCGRTLLARWGPVDVVAPASQPGGGLDLNLEGFDPRQLPQGALDALLAKLREDDAEGRDDDDDNDDVDDVDDMEEESRPGGEAVAGASDEASEEAARPKGVAHNE